MKLSPTRTSHCNPEVSTYHNKRDMNLPDEHTLIVVPNARRRRYHQALPLENTSSSSTLSTLLRSNITFIRHKENMDVLFQSTYSKQAL